MLYEELKKLTADRCTMDEYNAINAVYMELDEMTKEEAAALWKKLFLPRYKARKAAEAEKANEQDKRARSLAELDRLTKDAWHGKEITLANGERILVHWDTRFITRSLVHLATCKVIAYTDCYGTLHAADGNPYKLTA